MSVIRGGYNSYGQKLGILLLDTKAPRMPGDIGNATTFKFPVRYKKVEGITVEKVINNRSCDSALVDSFIEAGKELEKEGIKAITTSCGFTALFQKKMVESLNLLVFMSSLIQIPLVHSMIGKNKIIGVLTANKEKLTKKHLEAVGVKNIPVCIYGMEKEENFANMILNQQPFGNITKIEKEIIKISTKLGKKNENIGAIVLECANMPPFAHAIQCEIGLPVFDLVSLANYVYNAIICKKYNGYI